MSDNESEAMAIIHRAAILMKDMPEACLTPGAVYESQLDLPNTLSIKVTLSDEQAAALSAQVDKHPYRIPYMDSLLHDYFQVAVSKILAGKVV